jgi:hypothetical protein
MKSHISGIQIPTAARINIDGGLTLDAQAGNSGEMLISQGANVTPIWSNTLTSPTITTSLLTGSTSFNLLTTTATTINFGLAATTLNIATNNVTKTINLGTSGASSTTVNIGTSATSSSTINLQATTINVGRNSPSAGTGVNAFITGPAVSGNTTVTAGHVYIRGGGAGHDEEFNTGTVTGGNLYLDAGYASTIAGTVARGGVLVGTTSDTGSVSVGRTGITTTVTGALVGTTTTTSVAPLRLPTGTVPTTANQQFGMIAADAESLQIATTKTTGAGPGFGLIRAPQMVFSLANAPASANSTTGVAAFAAANDVLSSLEANKLYTFKGKYYVTYTAGGAAAALRMLFAFANAPQAIKYNFRTTKSTSATTMEQVGIGEVTTGVNVSTSNQVTGTLTVEFDGYFTSNATTGGTITPQIAASATTSGGTFTVTTGSWFEIQKIGSATQTLIAGNWG